MQVVQVDDSWSAPSPQDSSPKVEYETQAELWLVNKPGLPGATRKLQASQQRKRNDKREVASQLTALTDGSPKKLKEKSSWLGLSKGYGTATSADGQWIRVRCVLSEQHERDCRLDIIGDKETLQHSLNIRLLKATDIRFTDRSLVYRNNCISINAQQPAFHAHSPSLQAVMSRDYTNQRSREGLSFLDPIFLAFEHKDAANAWCAVLRSFAVPEIYGYDGGHGLYRMWRQITLSILNAKNVGIGRKLSNSNLDSIEAVSAAPEELPDAGPDLYMSCEVVMDGVIIARTTPQRGQAANSDDPSALWTWHESFVLSDLPQFRPLIVRVWRTKKGSLKPALLGRVEVEMGNYRKGQFHEGWFPVFNSIQVGNLRMKIKVDEEIILPAEAYASVISTLDNHNCLDLLSELDHKLRLSDMSIHMLSLAVGRGTFVKDILELAEREVDNAANPNTLFRGNSIFTKTVEHAMTFFGRSFLEMSVGPSILELVAENVELETDHTRNVKGPKDLEMSARSLPVWCQKFWMNIYSMRENCPPELRLLFKSIRELVEQRFKDNEDATNLKWQGVSAFCFLRLIVPAILHPHLWGICPGLPSPGLQRSLTLIAKNLQSLANLAKEKKEHQVQGVSMFLESNRALMIDYINVISSPAPDRPQVFRDKSDRLRILHGLKTRRNDIRATQPLRSESIPVLPHLLDVPKHLAILTSAVTRNARGSPQSLHLRPLAMAQESLVEDFAMKCFEIEEKVTEATRQVELHLLATSAATTARHPQRVVSRNSSSPGSPGGYNNDPSENSSSGPHITEVIIRHPRESHRARRPSGRRPSTAPARSSSTDSASMPLPPSPPPRLLRGQASDDSGVSSPPMSPMARGFGHQSSASASLPLSTATERGGIPLVTSDTEAIPDSQLDIDVLDPTKTRKGFLRGFLGRNPKA